jgi:DNA replication protein DnaD
MENVKERVKIHLTTSDENAKKWFSKLTFKQCIEIHGVHMIETFKTEITYDKPVYLGSSILDLSKLHMMNFHYNVIHKDFEGKYNLIYTDTDSFIYLIEHDDIYEWVKENKVHFDLAKAARPDLKDDSK